MNLLMIYSRLLLSGCLLFTSHSKKVVSNAPRKSLTPLYLPKSENQKKYVELLQNKDKSLIVSLGPAGCGKTLFACAHAIESLKQGEIQKIVLTRPMVSVEDEEIGFLPGNIVSKMDPWTKPIFDIFLEFFNKAELDVMLYSNKIEICPLAFMRGRTFKNAVVIADEMQNSSPNQMKMLVTRLGYNSRMVITGDLHQSDIKGDNGLRDFIHKFENHQSSNNKTELIQLVHFDNVDIERSDVVKKVIEIYDFQNDKIMNSPNKIPVETKLLGNNPNDAALIPFHHYYRW
jgi:phosphate starvation-inducible PhoH-like protein